MQLILLIGGLLLLDLLSMRFGVDSRILDERDRRSWWPDLTTGDPLHGFARSHQAQLHYDANVQRLALLATVRRPALRIRLAYGLRALALLIEPATRLSSEPVAPAPVCS